MDKEPEEYLGNAKFDKALRISKGEFVHNYRELLIALEQMSDEEFAKRFRAHDTYSDISQWITENFHDERLVKRLSGLKTRKQYLLAVDHRIKTLDKRDKLSDLLKKHGAEQTENPGIAWNVIFMACFVVIVLVFFEFIYNEDMQMNATNLDEIKRSVNDATAELSQCTLDLAATSAENTELKRKLAALETEQTIIAQREDAMPGPRDRIKTTDIRIQETQLVIKTDNAVLSEFTSTGSMLPVLSSTATAIQIMPKNESEIYPGDIISYELEPDVTIIHRVLEVGMDAYGWYAVTKGDNNDKPDKDRVRFGQIRKVLIGILY